MEVPLKSISCRSKLPILPSEALKCSLLHRSKMYPYTPGKSLTMAPASNRQNGLPIFRGCPIPAPAFSTDSESEREGFQSAPEDVSDFRGVVGEHREKDRCPVRDFGGVLVTRLSRNGSEFNDKKWPF